MKFNFFIQMCEEWWDKYLQEISRLHSKGRIEPAGSQLLYPSIMLATRCGDCYILGLIGANREFRLLRPKKHTERSVYRYLNQFDAEKPDAFFEISKTVLVGFLLLDHVTMRQHSFVFRIYSFILQELSVVLAKEVYLHLNRDSSTSD